jgi:hypothetical protein
MEATIQDIEKITAQINTVLATGWNVKTGFLALCEQFEKYNNIFECFASGEDRNILEGYNFALETSDGWYVDFTIVQYYADIKKFTVVC